MRHQGRRSQGELIDFIEQRLGWEVVMSTLEEDEGLHDDPETLRIELVAELELDDDSDFRYDPDRDELQRRP